MLAGLYEIAAQRAGVVKRQEFQVRAVETDLRCYVGRVKLERRLIAPVVGIRALVETAHIVGATEAELFAGHQCISRHLPGQ